MTTRTTNLLLVAVVALLTSLIVNVGAQLPSVSVIGAVTPGNCTKFASTLQLQDAGTTCGPNAGTGAVLSTGAGNPTSTTSGSYVMMGIGSSCSITPTTTGRLFISLSGQIAESAVSQYLIILGYIGSGTIPTNGAAVPGGALQVGGLQAIVNNANTAGTYVPATILGPRSGFTLGTSYWVDFAISNQSAGNTAAVINTACGVIEF